MEKVFVEKYRPHKIADMILPKALKSKLQLLVDEPAPPPIILVGKPGLGKTTAALAITEEKDAEVLFVNGSLDRNIDTLRNEITNFASGRAFNSKRKYVIIDEADNLNAQYTQLALRSLMEEYSTNCGFILTANYPNKLIEPIRASRCVMIEFKIPKAEKIDLMGDMIDVLADILHAEKIAYKANDLPVIIQRYFPDFRKTLSEIQIMSMSGTLVFSEQTNDFTDLIKAIKSRNYGDCHKWYVNNVDNDFAALVRHLYDNMKNILKPESIPVAIMLLNDYSYKNAFVVDQEINTMAMLTALMSECEWR